MADMVFQKSDVDIFSGNAESEKKISKKRSVFFIVVLTVIFLFLLVEVVYYLLVIPTTSKPNIQFRGNDKISLVKLKLLSGLQGDESWRSINTFELAQRFSTYPLIESVNVEKKFPDKVLVNIIERKPVAIGFTTIDGISIPLKIDKYGVIFEVGVCEFKALPVISGLSFKNAKIGMQVNKSLLPLFMQLEKLQIEFGGLMNEISEIKIVEKKFGGYELLVYPVKTPVHVRTQDLLTGDVLKYIMLVVDVINGTGVVSSIREVDIRSGNAVYVKQGVNDE
ncbi:MAG: cell division protein [Treponema sp.]|nr:MAG: cell division protein [Treponema sp.]